MAIASSHQLGKGDDDRVQDLSISTEYPFLLSAAVQDTMGLGSCARDIKYYF